MKNHIEKGKEIIKLLINSGHEAYFIGECVRNIIAGLPTTNFEIATNAVPDVIAEVLSFTKTTPTNDGLVCLYHGYEFLISTFRLESPASEAREPVKYHYSKNLLHELARRDFTINALVMSHNERVTDAYLGFKDLEKKIIKTIGKPRNRFSENPEMILTALGLVSELDFKIHRATYRAMRRRKKLLAKLPLSVIYAKMDVIIRGPHRRKAFSILYENGLHRYLPSMRTAIRRLARHRFAISEMEQFIGVCAVLEDDFHTEYFEFVENKEYLLDVIEIAYRYPKAKYSDINLLYLGEDAVFDAIELNYLAGKARNYSKRITRQYKKMVIKSIDDLAFGRDEIIALARERTVEEAEQIVLDVARKVANEELANDYDLIKIHVINLLGENNDLLQIPLKEDTDIPQIPPQINKQDDSAPTIEILSSDDEARETISKDNLAMLEEQTKQLINVQSEAELEQTLLQRGEAAKSDAERKMIELELRLEKQEELLREKDAQLYELEKQTFLDKLNNDIDKMVQHNIENLKELNYLEISYSEKVMLSRELHRLLHDFVASSDSKFKKMITEGDNNDEN